jgi:hypothetical protein
VLPTLTITMFAKSLIAAGLLAVGAKGELSRSVGTARDKSRAEFCKALARHSQTTPTNSSHRHQRPRRRPDPLPERQRPPHLDFGPRRPPELHHSHGQRGQVAPHP